MAAETGGKNCQLIYTNCPNGKAKMLIPETTISLKYAMNHL
jgi:hypothetical protein